MPPVRSLPHDYRGIKRIQQACLNCRRKKTKCSGERPICSYCKRLSQTCEWKEFQPARLGSSEEHPVSIGSASDVGISPSDESLLTRMATIESKLDELNNTVRAFLPILSSIGNTALISTSPVQVINMENVVEVDGPASATAMVQDRIPPLESSFRQLPPPEVLADLVDTFFSRVHSQPYSFFHERSFRERLADGLLPEYLQFAVVASSIRFSSNPYFQGNHSEAITRYASESWKQIVSLWFGPESDPDLNICRAITLLSVIDFTAGKRHPGWLKIGLSIRIAQDLRLMMEPDSAMSYIEQEERRRVFWSIYILDKLCSCGRGRPAALADAQCLIQLPCDEESFRNGQWKDTPTLAQVFSSTEASTERPSPFAMVVLTASVLGRCAQHNIHESTRGNGHLPPWDSKSEHATIYTVLLRLEAQFDMNHNIGHILQQDCMRDGQLDTQLAGPIVFSHALFRTCQCLLHHPFLLNQHARLKGIKAPPSYWNQAMHTCRENAEALSRLLQEIKIEGYSAFFSFMGYCATVSGSVCSLYLDHEDAKLRQQASEYFQNDLQYLEEFSAHWKHGIWMVTIMENLAAQSANSKTLLSVSPQWQNLDSDQVENLWASVDYTTMSQCFKSTASPSFDSFSPTCWNPLLALDGYPNAYTSQPKSPQSLEATATTSVSTPRGDRYTMEGMSPFISFFGGTSTAMDFRHGASADFGG